MFYLPTILFLGQLTDQPIYVIGTSTGTR